MIGMMMVSQSLAFSVYSCYYFLLGRVHDNMVYKVVVDCQAPNDAVLLVQKLLKNHYKYCMLSQQEGYLLWEHQMYISQKHA